MAISCNHVAADTVHFLSLSDQLPQSVWQQLNNDGVKAEQELIRRSYELEKMADKQREVRKRLPLSQFLNIDQLQQSQVVQKDSLHPSQLEIPKKSRLVSLAQFKTVVNQAMIQKGPSLTKLAKEKLINQTKQQLTQQYEMQVQVFKDRGMSGQEQKGKVPDQKTQKQFDKILAIHVAKFMKKYSQMLLDVVDELEQRFLYQLQENSFQPLEINSEISDDLATLARIIFESEVAEREKNLINDYVVKSMYDAHLYTRTNVLKSIFNNQLNLFALDNDQYEGKKMVYIDDEMRNYVPGDFDEFFKLQSGAKQRLIFGEPITLSQAEVILWQHFLTFIGTQGLEALPEEFMGQDREGLRYLVGYQGNFQRTYDELMRRHQYEMPTYSEERHGKYMAMGAFYVSGRMGTRGYQPVFHIDLAKLKEVDIDIAEELAIVYFDWIVKNMLVPGHVETTLVIFDCSNLGIHEIPLRALKPVLNAMETLFKGRAMYTLFVNGSWLLRGIFRIMQLWVGQATREGMVMLSAEDTLEGLSHFLDVTEIERKFGGTKQNINRFFPPVY